MGKLTIVFLLFVLACAEKKYVQASADGTGRAKMAGVCDSRHLLPKSGYCVDFEWEKPQEGRRPGVALLKLWRPNKADSSPVVTDLGDGLHVVLWMPHMGGGHGSDPVIVEKVDTGTYRARRVFFSMPGLWEIRVFVKLGGDVLDQVFLPFTYNN